MKSSRLFSAMRSAPCARVALTILLATALTACVNKAADPGVSNMHSLPEPEIKVVNYSLVACEEIWDVPDNKVMDSSLYWLRAIDCAVRLSPAEARAQARLWPADDWQSAFKQAMLMDNGNETPVERRQYLQRLDGFIGDYPVPLRPLIQLWRDNQLAQLQLSEARTRYHHLQQSSDAQLDALRQQLIAQNKELVLVRRKLQTLTDIERQLSSRRSPDTSDNGHIDKNGAAQGDSVAVPDNTTQDAPQP
ncbi:two-component system QseEF-associated lipoprotein QseG [Erwinia sp. ErVv1]|uniref:two-component system QseEF-associated lipoprotein QseG n=1 Tax=Erwinia sp. ErVv1 TaxID=1603299 RepID=UPI00082D0B55|nr:two-component system QseEF-associated lipoprotein QseG [Erwinia sp. ErVv1]